jgi:hypothetical protein
MTTDRSSMDALAWLDQQGIALLGGRGPVPSLAETIAEEPIRGSWWGHRSGQAIFAASNALADSPDVLICKLIDGKVTFVHRRLWTALVALSDEIGPQRLARVDQEHTASGKHVNRVTPFPDWVPAEVRGDAERLSAEDARRALGPLVDVLLAGRSTKRAKG